MAARLRNAVLLGACYGCTIRDNDAFTPPLSSSKHTMCNKRGTSTPTALHNSGRNSPGFVGFSGGDNPDRGDGGGGYGGGGVGSQSPINSRRSMVDPFAPPSPQMMMSQQQLGGPRGIGGGAPWEEPHSVDMRGRQRVTDMRSNLSRRDNSRSINEDPRSTFDIDRRFSHGPHPSMMVPPHMQQQSRGYNDGRIQGGSRHTYQNSGRGGGRTFVETDGRPLDVEMEVWEGPANTPTKVRMYSEDGRRRPMNILTNGGSMGGTTSVRNVGSMEFPIRAGVSDGNHGGMMGGYDGGYEHGGYGRHYGAPISPIGDTMTMMPPSGMRPHGSNNPYTDGYGDRSPRPSQSRGETVQGGSLKTFSLPSHVDAAQVTITSDGLPVNAKVELWGTSSHIKQLAEVYNDDGRSRPFAAIIDVPGGENTIAVRNTGPLEYPIRVVVEPVGMGMMDGMGMGMGGGYGGGMMDMMDGGYGPPMGGPYLPPPPF